MLRSLVSINNDPRINCKISRIADKITEDIKMNRETKDFFEVIGDTSSTTEKMIRYIDIAIAKDVKS